MSDINEKYHSKNCELQYTLESKKKFKELWGLMEEVYNLRNDRDVKCKFCDVRNCENRGQGRSTQLWGDTWASLCSKHLYAYKMLEDRENNPTKMREQGKKFIEIQIKIYIAEELSNDDISFLNLWEEKYGTMDEDYFSY